jgi:Ca2+-binding EF-hand superfamily protein
MRTRTKVMLAVGAITLGTTTMVGASQAGGGWGRGHHGGGWGGGGDRLFEQFDANGDGLITQAEIDQVLGDRLASFDQNNDGSLNLEEYQALWLDAMRERMVDRFQAHDDDGDATVTVEEFVGSYSSMVRRLDSNDDGQLTREDFRRPRDRDRDDDDDDE